MISREFVVPLNETDTATRAEILDEAVYISYNSNTLWKSISTAILS